MLDNSQAMVCATGGGLDGSGEECFATAKFCSGVLNSRIVLFRCSRIATLSAIIRDWSNLKDVLAYRPLDLKNETVLAVGWLDDRKVPFQTRQLQTLFKHVTGEMLQPFFITDKQTLHAVLAHYEFRFLANEYADVYVACETAELSVQFCSSLLAYLSKFGSIDNFEMAAHPPQVIKCCFHDVRSAFDARKACDSFVGKVRVRVKGSLEEACKLPGPASPVLEPGLQVVNWMTGDFQRREQTTFDLDTDEKKYHHLKHRRLASSTAGPSFVPSENKIDIAKIRSGQDQRTTLMIRNVPNKINHNELKEYIDLTSKNLYDFLYLRVDFENHCNVGYAFISFTDPKHIIKFYLARGGKRWNKFNSEKVCEMSYARVQGRAKLIEKFRNSKVMVENPAYRPRLYHTEGPLKGTEIEFPGPTKRHIADEI
ncbi:hypothetical protein OGAPHI_005172 [Ogataea philodendri]|uniref:Mei2-like C-terminal RNA recognition motif domain-containing protein n=1 Tax=Ogataea philodendri TaxID=1378263 RepID=A0A9P8T331_9ASCO|nr:uncharacterized protein OGAPHI_005172 [Ogataea philodendri]KAH3663769.1 hypothetical protein OGAPHI_005172 [Ogataea philodendri]